MKDQFSLVAPNEDSLCSGGWNPRNFSKKQSTPSRDVFIYSKEVPNFGTYKVFLKLTAKDCDIKNMSLFAGRRNMILNRVDIKKGETLDVSFYTAVTPYIPALSSIRNNDRNIFVSLTGEGVSVGNMELEFEVTSARVPVVWVAGDSTLTDQNAGSPYYPYGSCCGWAQTILRFVRGAAVCNLAHSGMTSNCFRDDGHYAIAKEMMKEGDFFIIQFGHNDQKRRNLNAFKGYYDNLKKYVTEVRELGAEPIICSPISRIPLKDEDGSFYSLLKSYRDAAMKVSEEEKVTFIDLHEYTFDKWIGFKDAAKDFFIKGDITHTNEYGAVMIGDYFAEEIAKSKNCRLADYIDLSKKSSKKFMPDTDTKEIPQELPGRDIFKITPPYVDIKDIPEYKDVEKAFNYGLLDPCIMFLHPYAVMPRAQLLMVMFKAYRIAGVRPYKGSFKDIYKDEWDSGYVQTLINEKLVKESDFFYPDEPLTYEALAAFLIRFMEKDKDKRNEPSKKCLEKAIELGIIKRRSKEATSLSENYEIAKGDYISRAEVYGALARFMDIVGGAGNSLPSDAEVHPVH